MRQMTNRRIFLVLTGVILATVLVYWPGLNGPFLLDDRDNLVPVQRWQGGEIGFQSAIFSNQSGPLGRPVSMASFLADAALGADTATGFKTTNLILHILCGLLLFLLASRLARRDTLLSPHARYLALTLGAVWLLHPLMVSTVLYIVQRMAILSALFTVAALLAYINGREQIEQGRNGSGITWLFVGVPLLTALAALSKENGLLALLLCGVVEWIYFAPPAGQRRPRSARLFIWIVVFAPILAALALFVIHPEFYLGGYQNRPFSLTERLLTQGRVLFDYIGNLLYPVSSQFSLYRDDYAISRSILDPPATLAAWLGWFTLSGIAVALRKSIPGLAFGLGFFLAGHAMESSVFPLLLYFDHRNYLPAFGIFYAAASLLTYGYRRISAKLDHPEILARVATLALVLVLAGAAMNVAAIWKSKERLVTATLANFPESRFARMEAANLAMNSVPPDVSGAKAHYQYLSEQQRPSTRLLGQLGLLAISCYAHQEARTQDIEVAGTITPEAIEADLLKAIRTLEEMLSRSECRGLELSEYARFIADLANRFSAAHPNASVWRLRFYAARGLASAGFDAMALEQAELAWNAPDAELPVGMLVVQSRVRLGQMSEAMELLERLDQEIGDDDRVGRQLVRDLRRAVLLEK